MTHRKLGRTGLYVSELAFGCMHFGWTLDDEESQQLLAAVVDGGINFLDTADAYSRGESERIIGDFVRERGGRDQLVLATKGHNAMSDDVNDRGNSRRHLIAACEASLRRLQTDYIDLYQVHTSDPEIAIDETLGALDDLVRAGKVRYVGSSNFPAWAVVESLWVSEKLGLERFVCDQSPYHILDRRIERELVPTALTYGLGIIPWSPLAEGLLTGKYRKGQAIPPKTRYAYKDEKPHWIARYTDAALDAVEDHVALAADCGLTALELAMAWVNNQPGITASLVGARTVEQLADYLRVPEITLSDDVRARIDQIVPPGGMVSPFSEIKTAPHPYRV